MILMMPLLILAAACHAHSRNVYISFYFKAKLLAMSFIPPKLWTIELLRTIRRRHYRYNAPGGFLLFTFIAFSSFTADRLLRRAY